jgi:hypothetical protein
LKEHARDATWREATSDTWLKFSHNLKSRGPDQELQRRQRVYRQLGVQQALVLVQLIIRKRSRFNTSLLKNIYFNLLKLTYFF